MFIFFTTNLSTFFSVKKNEAQIDDADDLSRQKIIKYGAVAGGSTVKFFQDSDVPSHQRLWKAMSADPTLLTSSNVEGRERVIKEKGQYAFFMESTQIEYITERNCELQKVGELLDSKSYGIAFTKSE